MFVLNLFHFVNKFGLSESCDSDGKESAFNVEDLGSIPVLGRPPGEGNSYPLQYSGLENSMDRGNWQAIVHGVTKSQTRLSDFHFNIYFKLKKVACLCM